MKRRDFITLLGGAVAGWPLMARAQQRAKPVIGYLSGGVSGVFSGRASVFLLGLAEYGYIDDQNVVVEYRWAEGHYDRLPALAADLVSRRVDVIVIPDNVVTAQVAKAATATIPIVFGIGADPVASGLVESLKRPGGNLTGATRLSSELEPKRLQLLHELVPAARTFALLINPGNLGSEALVKEMEATARTLGLSLHVLQASTDRDLDGAFAMISRLHVEGIVISPDTLFVVQSPRLAALALREAVPTVFQYREFAVAGGLISYAASRVETYRLLGRYAGRILRGEKPADLPVQQSTTVELIINLKTARALGISVPLSMLARADEVIE